MVEILPYISGLRRNLVQCVRDYDIPLHLCTTVTRRARPRARGGRSPLARWTRAGSRCPARSEELACDTLLLSVGLIPENELSRMAGVAIDPITGGPRVDERYATSVPGIYAAGNVVHVYDLVDDVTESALRAGRYAAEHALRGPRSPGRTIPLVPGENVRHIVPQVIHPASLKREAIPIEFRVRQPIEQAVRAEIRAGEDVLVSQRLRYVRPSEMVVLSLGSGLQERVARADHLRVDIVTV